MRDEGSRLAPRHSPLATGGSMWEIDADVLESVSLGAGILGTGGGGNPYVAKIWPRGELERGARFQILDPAEVPDDAWVVGSGGIGAPTVSVEKLRRGADQHSAHALGGARRRAG